MHRWVVTGLVVGLVACGGGRALPPLAADSAPTRGGFWGEETSESAGRQQLRIVRSYVGLAVADVAVAIDAVSTIAADVDAFVESESRHQDDAATIVLRVPAPRLDEALSRLSALGEEFQRRIEARDVTDEVGDLEARRQNLIALRDRLRKLLGRARKVEEVLSVEKELTRLQTELDALEGRLARLRHDVARSRIEVTLTKQRPKRILGPLGYLWEGTAWFVEKLFVIRRGEP